MDPVRVAAKAVIVDNNRLLALRLHGREGDYYMLPGGGHDVGETLQETLLRECLEEIGAAVEPGPVLWIRDYREVNHEFSHVRPEFHELEIMFQCTLLGQPDMEARGDTRQQGLVWIPLDEIEDWPFYPKELRKLLAAGIPDTGASYLGDVN